MIQKGLALFAALLLLAQSCPAAFGQSNASASSSALASRLLTAISSQPSTAAAPQPASPTVKNANPGAISTAPSNPAAPQPATPGLSTPGPTDCFNGACDYQPPHISIATPAPAPAPWPWQSRIAWGANIILVILGYIAILVALSLLRKIERQTRYSETAADAAREAAMAALAHTQALVRAERPWVLINVRPAQGVENGFTVVATNHGRGPARILSTVDEVVSATDESRLAPTPEYRSQPVAPADPIILLPGESTEILAFSRADVKRICESEERMARVEKWEEKIFLYGNVVYRDLATPDDAPAHESSWFCWYIHGRQKSGMVMAGPPAYNRHT